MNPDLLILAATYFEISHFLALHPGDSKYLTKTGLAIISGKVGPKTYDLLITGPGVFNAAHALTVYLEKSFPSLVLQTGIAGVFKQTGCNIGDVAIATQEQYIHTGIQTDSIENDPLPFDLIEQNLKTRKGIYSFDQDQVDHYHDILCRKGQSNKINITKGAFITVSSITSSGKHADRIYSAFSPVMEAMEGAACAHIALLYDIPIIEVRSASNYVGERDKSKWDIDLAAKQLGWVCGCV
ncbi:MAG: futalosine hydrolase [Desulfobacula sp.]|jgi:futalosine hydrolase|uniref:futalosine hydrolase n=1 Tax=Desulfobacula sp. TaxID=2593537 RepID=UPI001DAA6E16|nr:futalosine hydrolase [Desulfobacula sp.]MBT3485064.1 futalosine hydrolase [Desulfobacula sp.]MBT3804632.1 futalosine hydrolase [Desulfobacula sp.]MBT4025075.1 futalosine hydrolase [Desulfobacula sp.]MBT4198228.1 futalosine hydrolase [Desulfobacula sp.]